MDHRITTRFIKYLSLLLLVATAQAKPISFGHNLSPTTETLESKSCTAGFYFLGCDVWQGHLTIGTSPWMVGFYNLENFILKTNNQVVDSYDISHQFAYLNRILRSAVGTNKNLFHIG